MKISRQVVCTCSTRLLSRDGSLLFQSRNKRFILNTILLTRITAHKQSQTMGPLSTNTTFNHLEMMQMSRQREYKVCHSWLNSAVSQT